MTRLLFLLKGLAWTALLAGLLFGADRLLVRPPEKTGWVAVGSLGAIASEAGPVQVPSYLPEWLGWPPAHLLQRTRPDPGWWLGIAPAAGGPVVLWVGSGKDDAPKPMGEAANCLSAAPRCPAGWHHLSRQAAGGAPVHVVARMSSREVIRVFQGLQPRPVNVP